MRDQSNTVSLGWKSIYRFVLDLLRSEDPPEAKPQNQLRPIDPAGDPAPEAGGRPENDPKADPHEEIYNYLYLYWFI